ncbi:hypothetical protein SELMODRAFT_272288 [Selaginella moellendorffii]|uniref:DSBA-like thioredoxin domain-containing protein n=1 Tax=Selaginella moellendorffii TaxID=88036 RepID=D8TAV3_SELML|nr:uncharacterized protein LOC9630569 [Selaginella moellendorffii]XP_002993714.1 uncharacterized protein LOC9638431 [Selaginella moellendorffii]EFJ05206.1 hypothetical protein SELMODRAFT_163159 [Selaginella moellendorffii]EFJ06217.1 hypothetical protein SELMODRAFT_272288 [Selaginella moellendorffii]|eukprot:XP_002992736.1 uncharacterized protein LOC9630569 [Selaginella moellendorffii]
MPRRKLVEIDVTSDTVCPWCYIGKKNLERAIEASADEYDFEVRWRPYLLNPSAPVEGVDKLAYYKSKFGEGRFSSIVGRLSKVFEDVGLEINFGGLTGNTLDSHRLIELAGRQGYDKQNALVEELFLNYLTQEKYIGDRQVLVDAADKVGVTGASEFLADPNAGLKEVLEQLKKYGTGVNGVPHFLVNGKYQLSGAQPPSSFIEVFKKS